MLSGPVPPQRTREITVDTRLCGKGPIPDRALQVDPATSGVRWAVVTLDAPGYASPPAVIRALDQARCEYHPYVSVVPPGSRIVVRNADAGLHDVHIIRDGSDTNHTLRPDGHVEIPLSEPGTVLFACDLHYWTRAWVIVTPASFATVTDETGRFELSGVPSGPWRLSVWHERLGTTVRDVMVEADARLVADISLAPALPSPNATQTATPPEP